jgi:hypothetical protein
MKTFLGAALCISAAFGQDFSQFATNLDLLDEV